MDTKELANALYNAHQTRGIEVDRDVEGDWMAVARQAKLLLQPVVVFASKLDDGRVEVFYSDGSIHHIAASKFHE